MESPPAREPSPWLAHEQKKTNGTSVLAFLSSISGFFCLFGVGGALGIVLGLIARKEIARTERHEKGRRLAGAAIAVGILNVGLTVSALAMGLTYLIRPRPLAVTRSAPVATSPAWPAPRPAPHISKPTPAAPSPRASRESGVRITQLGSITLADVSGDLGAEIDAQRTAANAASETLILWSVVDNCKPCEGVSAALSSAVAQKSLARVRFLRVNRDEYQGELARLGIPTEKIPGFALLDEQNHPRDFIHGGEWDADIAANIAPVLGKFAHGAYKHRRDPWHGPAREDETPL